MSDEREDRGGEDEGGFREPPPPPPIPESLLRPVERPASMRARDERPSEAYKAASGYASAFTFIATVLAFGAAGWGVDWYLGTGPWGVIIGLTLGLVGGTVKLMREMNRPLD